MRVEEALAALDGAGVPGRGLLKVAEEHDVEPEGVRAVLLDDAVGVDDVAEALAHLDYRVVGHLAVLVDEGLLGLVLAAELGEELFPVLVGEVVPGCAG